jgi:hypothetical protein
MIAALALSVALLASSVGVGPGAGAGNLARLAEIEVTGPVRDLVVSLGSAGEARLSGELLPGERTRIVLPLPARDALVSIAPEIRWAGSDSIGSEDEGRGRARFVGWKPDLASKEIEDLLPGLRARSRPQLSPPEIHLPRASLAILPACLLIGLALRRRAAAALAFALAGSGVLLAIGSPRTGRAEREVTVLETDAESSSGLAVTATWERASLSTEDLAASVVDISKAGERVAWSGALSKGEAWTLTARGSTVCVERAFDAGEQVFRRAENRVRDLAEVWVREDGSWSARGAWPRGAALPPAAGGPAPDSAPPGWLAAGLPQGVAVLIGRAASAERSGKATWIRQTGI